MRAEAPSWAARYIGRPFRDKGRSLDGCDCFGLLRIIFAERWQIEIPDQQGYDGTDKKDAATCAALHERERETGNWLSVEAGQEREGDIIVIRVIGLPWHYGVVLAPGIAVETKSSRQGSVLMRYREPKYQHIVSQPGSPVQGSGFWRHKLMTSPQSSAEA